MEPAATDATPASRLAAIVFTDIVGYSGIVHRDEALGARLLERQREVVRRMVREHGGREIETAGDSFLLEFGSALSAVDAVLAIQQALARVPEPPPVVLRAAIHLGEVQHRGREIYGDGVNVAARLLPHSPEGGLALSAAVAGVIRQRRPLPLRSIGEPALKNIATPVEILVLDRRAVQAAGGAVARNFFLFREGPHGVLVAALLQAVMAVFVLGLGLMLVLAPYFADEKVVAVDLSAMLTGLAVTLLAVAMLGNCYGLARLEHAARRRALILHALNILAVAGLTAMLTKFAAAHAWSMKVSVLFTLAAPGMSMLIAGFLLHPAVGSRFTRH